MNKIEIDDGSVSCVFNGTNPMKFFVRFSVLGNNNILYFLKEHILFVFFVLTFGLVDCTFCSQFNSVETLLCFVFQNSCVELALKTVLRKGSFNFRSVRVEPVKIFFERLKFPRANDFYDKC